MRAAERPVLAFRRVDGEHRYLGVIEAVEGQRLAVGAPPEGLVLRRPAENFLIIHPAGVTVHDGFRAVGGEAGFLTAFDICHPEIVVAGESKHRGIRAEGEVHGALRFEWEVRVLLRGLEAFGTDGFAAL